MSNAYAALFKKKADPFYPMPNTGTILDISAGQWVGGHKGQKILNGGFALFWAIAALPNMFKSTIAAFTSGAVLRAFPHSTLHVHDTETTMVIERVERMTRMAMGIRSAYNPVPENLLNAGRMFFTRSVDYNGTELMDLIKGFAKERRKSEKKIDLEILHPDTGGMYAYYNPVLEFWDSFSGLKAENAEVMLDEGKVGHKDLNMLAMRVNSGKSQMVEQIPDLCASSGIYLLATAHVGQAYELDPRKPGVKTLKFLKGEVKLKRVPENFSFQTGNCYVVTSISQLVNGSGKDAKPEWPYEPGDEDKQNDLFEVKLTNMRGKFGISNVAMPFVISQKDGLIPEMSNYLYLKEEGGKFGIVGNDRNYALALTPDVKMQRTDIRLKFRQNPRCITAVYHLANMHYMFTYWNEFDQDLVCDPTELYEEIKKMGYDWDLLLDTRYWFMPTAEGEKIPFISTMDLLLMRVGKYHPYWYPKSRKEMGLPEIESPGGILTKK